MSTIDLVYVTKVQVDGLSRWKDEREESEVERGSVLCLIQTEEGGIKVFVPSLKGRSDVVSATFLTTRKKKDTTRERVAKRLRQGIHHLGNGGETPKSSGRAACCVTITC